MVKATAVDVTTVVPTRLRMIFERPSLPKTPLHGDRYTLSKFQKHFVEKV